MKNLLELLKSWPKGYISTSDILSNLRISQAALYSLTKRAVLEKVLLRLRRDFYLIEDKIRVNPPNAFELAPIIYGPSYVSFESALSYYGWIPEGVKSTTCATGKRSRRFETSIGLFSYHHIPLKVFHIGVKAIEMDQASVLIAEPWKALADFIYSRKSKWTNINQLSTDLRIELESMQDSNLDLLEELTQCYPSIQTRKVLKSIWGDLKI